MPLVSAAIPNLINGVSQQPDAIRQLSHCEALDDMLPSVVEGLRKRPPIEHLAKLITGSIGSAYVHVIDRGYGEQYIMILVNGDLFLFKTDGTAMTVSFPDGKGYLAVTDASKQFRALTVADYTFVVNTTKTIVMKSGSKSPTNGVEAMVHAKQVQYSTDFNVFVNDDTAAKGTYTTAASGNISSVGVIADLVTDLTTALGASWTITNFGPTLHIKKNDLSDFNIKATDGRSNTCLKAYKGTVQRFVDLPTTAKVGFIAKVLGDTSQNEDDFYVKFRPTNSSSTGIDEGVWEETVAPNIDWEFDPTVMPFSLTKTGPTTFTFAKIDWTKRLAGDEDSAPNPSFVGKAINDIFFFKNRLGFLSEENVIMSAVGEPFQFWPTTVQQILDSDPIDVACSNKKVSYLRYALPFDEKLLLFSDQSQFILSGGDVLSPSSVSIDLTTEYEASQWCPPVNAGQNVFFGFERTGFSGVREFFVDGDTGSNDAADITVHVPKYLAADVRKLAACSIENQVVALAAGDRSKLFLYSYYWNGKEKLQSSWSQWNMPGSVLSVEFLDTRLFVISQYSDGVYLEIMDVAAGYTDVGGTILTHLDRKVTEAQCSASYSGVTGNTTFTLPYSVPAGKTVQLVTRTGAADIGVVKTPVSVVGDTVQFFGDLTAVPCYIGLKYQSLMTFSKFVVKEDAPGGGRAVVGEARVQIRAYNITHSDTGYYKATVTYPDGQVSNHVFTGRIVGSNSNVIGQISIETGNFKFPVLGRNYDVTVTLTNDTFLPTFLLSAEVEAWYQIRSKRL